MSTNIIGALWYLRITSLRNAVVGRLKRLKQPKYLVGGIIGVTYLYFVFFRRMLARRYADTALSGAVVDDLLPVTLAVGALFLLIALALCWVWPRERAALRFSEAEIAFLFPAPVRRQTLIHYQLLSAQWRILFTALIVSLFSGGWSFIQGNIAIRIAGWWIIVATLSLHVMGSSFVITRLLDRGVTSLRRQVMTIAAIAALIAGIVAWTWRDIYAPSADDLAGFSAFARYLADLLSSGPLPWLLLPTKLVIQPLLATDLRSFLLALGPALLLYAAHYWWVVRSEVSFEEATIARAEKRAAKVAALKQGKYRIGNKAATARRAPFILSSAQRVEFAFLWKNLLASASYLRLRTAVIVALVIVAVCGWFSGHPVYEAMRPGLAIFILMIGAYLVVLGPLLARQDLRSDLPNTDILKTYPLRGWQIILGELLTPLAIITALVWLTLLAATLTMQTPQRMDWITPQLRIGIAIGLALIAPLLCTLQLLVLNTAAVLFPAWMQNNRQAGGGIDVMGQRLLFLAGNMIVVLVALLPAATAASSVWFVSRWIVGDVMAGAMALVVVLAILIAEAALGIRWLGARFDRFDLSAEMRA